MKGPGRWGLRLAGAALVLASGAPPVLGQTAGEQARAEGVVAVAQALLDAFNRHDPSGMAAWVSPDFELFYVGEDGRAELAVTGPEALEAEMSAYFRAQPDVRSEVEGVIGGSRFVAFRERIVGGDSSLAVYEIADGRVRRSWYYPAEPRDPDGVPPGGRP